VVIHHERAGGMLGETALFAGTPYPASAVAAEPTTCRLLPAERVMALLASDPAIATFFLRRLAERLTLVIGRLDSLSRVSVAVRLATHLRGRPGAGDGQPVTLGMTQRELAQELGTVREVVVRELRRLVRRGVLQPAGRGCYRVADPALLATIAGH
jgi:CRP/FNR family transcriptional regulator